MQEPGRREQPRGAARRQQLVDAALDLVAESGTDFSWSELARRCEITDAGVRHHFASRRDLLLAVFAEIRRRDTHLLEGFLAGGFTQLLVRLPELAPHDEERRGLVRLQAVLLAESLADGPGPTSDARPFVLARFRAYRARLSRSLLDSGLVADAAEADECAASFVAHLDGLQTQWLLDPDAVPLGPGLVRLASVWSAALSIGRAP